MVAPAATVAAGLCLAAYSLLLVYVCYQIVVLCRQGHKVASFQVSFNIQIAAWTLLRTAFWGDQLASPDSDWSTARFVVFWTPHAIQLATFAILALFFFKTLYRDSWATPPEGRTFSMRTWAVLIVVAGCIVETAFVLAAAVLASEDDAASTSWATAEAFGSAAIFMLLAAVFCFLGCRLAQVPQSAHTRMMIMHPLVVVRINYVLFGIFASRSLFNIVSASGVFALPIASQNTLGDLAIVAIYAVWEIAPVVILLCTIARGARGSTMALHEQDSAGMAFLWGQSVDEASAAGATPATQAKASLLQWLSGSTPTVSGRAISSRGRPPTAQWSDLRSSRNILSQEGVDLSAPPGAAEFRDYAYSYDDDAAAGVAYGSGFPNPEDSSTKLSITSGRQTPHTLRGAGTEDGHWMREEPSVLLLDMPRDDDDDFREREHSPTLLGEGSEPVSADQATGRRQRP
jgi:hypothetical protein